MSGNIKVAIVLMLTACTIPLISGLQCHVCMHMGNVLTDDSCKSVEMLSTKKYLRPCSMENALNAKEMKAIQMFSPEAKFHLVCLKAVIKAEGVDLLIRGCYAQDEKKLKTWTKDSQCQTADDNFWKELGKEGKINSASQNAIKNARMSVCACHDKDGCNSANSVIQFPFFSFLITILITIASL